MLKRMYVDNTVILKSVCLCQGKTTVKHDVLLSTVMTVDVCVCVCLSGKTSHNCHPKRV